MYYFDNKYLAQYIDQRVKLKVYVNSDWYELTDLSDVSDPRNGVGYNEYGEGTQFDYRAIKQIQVNNSIITLDQLQTQMTGKSADTEKKPSSKSEGPPEEEMPEEEPPAKEKEPDLSWFSPAYDLGRQLMKEAKNANRNKRRS